MPEKCIWKCVKYINAKLHSSSLITKYITGCGKEYEREYLIRYQSGKMDLCPGCNKPIQLN